mmetsp:Transcript_22555/g.27660  ORF Transcript_22555/g.27660 Transcript_22555/m.27660 type:complete len:519 (-) Transcript_22555:36-1592(-)
MVRKYRKPGSVHVIFGATCSNSMDWKSIAVFHSFRTAGWTDNITRLIACTEEQLQTYKGMDIGPTFVFKDQQSVEGYEDSPTYNKPAGIMHFTQEADIDEEFILFVDADMLFRRVIRPEDFKARKGLVITEWVWYVQSGIKNGLAEQFLTDPLAVERAKGTHGGYYHLFHVDDAKKVAPLWLQYTKEVRHHPEKYFADLPGSKLKNDINVEQKGSEYGEVPWISEMYGYAFAAADVGLEHKFTRGGGGVLYGDDFLSLNHDGPILSHYTLSCHVPSIEIYDPRKKSNDDGREDYKFDKNEFRKFDVLDCDDGFLFPRPNELIVDEGAGSCAENVERINNAICDFYRRRCPSKSRAYRSALHKCPFNPNAPFNLHHDRVRPAPCGDTNKDYCRDEAQNGRCMTDPAFMQLNCLKACGFCVESQPDGEKRPCKDKFASEKCIELAEQMECVLNPTYMIANCRETCNHCPNNQILLKSQGYSISMNAGIAIISATLLFFLSKFLPWRRYISKHGDGMKKST